MAESEKAGRLNEIIRERGVVETFIIGSMHERETSGPLIELKIGGRDQKRPTTDQQICGVVNEAAVSVLTVHVCPSAITQTLLHWRSSIPIVRNKVVSKFKETAAMRLDLGGKVVAMMLRSLKIKFERICCK